MIGSYTQYKLGISFKKERISPFSSFIAISLKNGNKVLLLPKLKEFDFFFIWMNKE